MSCTCVGVAIGVVWLGTFSHDTSVFTNEFVLPVSSYCRSAEYDTRYF